MLFSLADVRGALIKRANEPLLPPAVPAVLEPRSNPFRTGGQPQTQFKPDFPAAAPPQNQPPAAAPGGNLLNVKLPKLPTAPSGMGLAMGTAGHVLRTPGAYAERLSQQYFPGMTDTLGAPRAELLGRVTENAPPSMLLGDTLGAFSGPVNSVMGMAQKAFKDNPAGFAGVVGGLGRPLIEPLMGTPAGLPAMAALYGMTVGGKPLSAAYTYFRPVLDKLNL